MALREILDRQAEAIEYVLHTHGIDAHVEGGKLSPRLAHFLITLPQGASPSHLAPIVPELAAAVGVVSCRLAPSQDGLYLEVPRPDPVPVRLLPMVRRVEDIVPPLSATLGVDGDGTPLLLRLNSPDVDPVIISGNPGSGKSSLLRTMALSLALHNSPERLRLLLLDPGGEGVAFAGFEALPHLACPAASGPAEALLGLRWAMRVLSRRSRLAGDDEELFFGEEEDAGFEDAPVGAEEPALAIMIDGADDLCSTGNRRADAEAAGALNRLLSAGRAYGIHIVLSAQRPDQIVGATAIWGARIAGQVPSAELARIATGVKGSGAQALLGEGDFLISLNADLIRFQAPEVSEREVAKAVQIMSEAARDLERSERARREDTVPPAPRFAPGRSQSPAEEPLQFTRQWKGE